MNLVWTETVIHIAGGMLAYATLAVVLYGIWKGTHREAGRTSGKPAGWLRSMWAYTFATGLFIGLCWFGWKAIPLTLSSGLRLAMLAVGSLLLIPGLALVLWGRLSLGGNYFVSTSRGAQLLEGQQLVTGGPYTFIRHPMYTGLMLAALGSLAVYFTWTCLAYAVFAPFVAIRARHEDEALEAEFGEKWKAYRKRAGGFFPRFTKEG